MPQTQGIQVCERNSMKLKSHSDPHTLTVGGFSTPFLPMDRSTRQKQSGDMVQLTEIMNQLDLTNIYRTFHTNTNEYTFLSAPHRTFSKTDHISETKQVSTDT